MSNNNSKSAAQKAAEKAMTQDDQKPEDVGASLLSETENQALREEVANLTKALAELQSKVAGPVRKATKYEHGQQIPEHHGVFTVTLQKRGKNNVPGDVLYQEQIVALDESEAMRQGLLELCDKVGEPAPLDWVRRVTPTPEFVRERELRTAFGEWRSVNGQRQKRGESLLPLPPTLAQFEPQLTEIERMACRQLETAQ